MSETIKWEDIEPNFPYKDILNIQRPTSHHKKMSKEERASQFAPFSALTGYEDLIKEESRDKDDKITLAEDTIEKINNILIFAIENKKQVKLTYFTRQKIYKTIVVYVKKYDNITNSILTTNNLKIPILDILRIDII